MEDAATAEISRAQLWQWVHHNRSTAEGDVITADFVRSVINEEVAQIVEADPASADSLAQARDVFESVALGDEFLAFLTLPAYELLD
ncbi:MAG: hypothetical protein IH940_09715 [Acidobacteria bacterium]|nr:hypothetical protein [Acidobacteriota bacterium]